VIGFIDLIAIAMTMLSVIRIARTWVSRFASAAPRGGCARGMRGGATPLMCFVTIGQCGGDYDAARNSMSSQEDVCSLS
jgi:hypothetical protein